MFIEENGFFKKPIICVGGYVYSCNIILRVCDIIEENKTQKSDCWIDAIRNAIKKHKHNKYEDYAKLINHPNEIVRMLVAKNGRRLGDLINDTSHKVLSTTIDSMSIDEIHMNFERISNIVHFFEPIKFKRTCVLVSVAKKDVDILTMQFIDVNDEFILDEIINSTTSLRLLREIKERNSEYLSDYAIELLNNKITSSL